MNSQLNLRTPAITDLGENENPTHKPSILVYTQNTHADIVNDRRNFSIIPGPTIFEKEKSDPVVVSCIKKERTESWTPSPVSRTATWRLPFLPKIKGQDDAQWGIHYFMPLSMCVLGIAGICGAVAHHVYNKSLHGELVQDPQWPQRFGLALAFFTKMCLIAAVEIAYKQQSWVGDITIRRLGLVYSTKYANFSALFRNVAYV